MIKYIAVGIGLTLGNIFMASIGMISTWAIALDRSWWEITALISVALTDYLIFKGENE